MKHCLSKSISERLQFAYHDMLCPEIGKDDKEEEEEEEEESGLNYGR